MKLCILLKNIPLCSFLLLISCSIATENILLKQEITPPSQQESQNEDVTKTTPFESKKPSSWVLQKDSNENYLYLRFLLALQHQNMTDAKHAALLLRSARPSEKIYLEIASFYLLSNKEEETIVTLEEAFQKHPSNFDLILLWSELIKDKKTVLNRVKAFYKKNPRDILARSKLYCLYYEEQSYTRIMNIFNTLTPSESTAADYFYAALAWNGLADDTKAISYLEKTLELNPDLAEAWFEMGLIYEKQQHYALAKESYSEVLRKNPDEPELWLRLLTIALKLNNEREAYELVLQGPQTNYFLLSSVRIFMEEGAYNGAEKILRIMGKKERLKDETSFYYALLYSERDKNYKKSLQYLDTIPRTSSLYPEALYTKVRIYNLQGKFEQSLRTAELSHREFPNSIEMVDLYGKALINTKQYTKAKILYTKVLKRWPDNVDLLYSLANTYDRLNDKENALKLMEKIITLDPDHKNALNYIGYLIVLNGGDLSRAKILLEKALFLDPQDIYVVDSLAWLYYREELYQKAWNLIQQAKDMDITSSEIWEHYGDIAKKTGRKQDAKYGYKKALELAPNNKEITKKFKSL
ncbi:MAG: tetratricopeptide repeat protein [Desulfovibrionaceae bacterium]